MSRKFTIDEFDKRMADIRASAPDTTQSPAAPAPNAPAIPNIPDVQAKVLAAARRRAAALRQPGSMI